MNLIQLQDKLKYEVSKQYLQPSVMIGSIYENLNTGELKYPVFNIDIEQIQEGSNDITYAIVAYYADRLIEDNSNKSNIKTDAITSMQLFIDSLRKSAGIAIETPVDIHLFEQQFVDKCAGSWVRLNLHTSDGIDYCGETVDITVKEITENGKYDTSNYDYTVVNVDQSVSIAEDEKRSVQITEDEEGVSILSACTTAEITPTKTVGYLDSGTVIPQGTSLQEILNKIFTKIRGLSGKTDVSGSISGITAATKEIGSTVDVSITASFTDGSWTNEGGWSNTHSGGKTTQPYGCTLTSYTYSGLISKAASTDASISGSGTISSGSNTVSVVISYSASKNVPVNENGVALTIGKSNTTTTYVPVSASTITKTTESYTGKYKIFYSDGAVSRSSSSVWADAYKNKAKTVAAGGVFRIAVPSGMTITNIDEAFAGNKIYGGDMTNENITFVDNVENLSLDGSKYRVYTISNANGTNPWVLLNITVA